MPDEVFQSDEEFLGRMILDGCIKKVAYDEEGGLMVEWNLDRLKELYPGVYERVWEAHLSEIDLVLSGLVDKGLVQMSFEEGEDGYIEAVYSLTEKGKEEVELMKSLGLDNWGM